MTEQDRDFKGIWFPKELWLADNLTWLEKLILLEIDSLSKQPKGCFASNKYMATMFGRSEQTITNTISKLKKLGLVEEISFDGRRRTLKTAHEKINSLPISFLMGSYKESTSLLNNTTTHAKHGIESSVESENKNVPSMKRTIPPSDQNKHWAVEYWNSLPDPSNLSQPKRKSKRPGPAKLPRHRNPNTKSYKDAARLIDQLQQGTFLGNGTKTRRRYIKAFFHGKNMPLALATSTWSNEMIEIGLKRTARVYYLGGWKPHSLADLIYNPHSKAEYYSFFFDAVYYWKKVEKRIENQDTETEMSTTVIYLPKPSQRDRMNKKVRLEDLICDISDELELPEETTLNGA